MLLAYSLFSYLLALHILVMLWASHESPGVELFIDISGNLEFNEPVTKHNIFAVCMVSMSYIHYNNQDDLVMAFQL